MTWLSGSCQTPQPATGQQLISTDAYPEPIVITDAEIGADEAGRDADGARDRLPNRSRSGSGDGRRCRGAGSPTIGTLARDGADRDRSPPRRKHRCPLGSERSCSGGMGGSGGWPTRCGPLALPLWRTPGDTEITKRGICPDCAATLRWSQ